MAGLYGNVKNVGDINFQFKIMSIKYKKMGKNYRAKSSKTIKDNPDNFFPTYHALTRHLLNAVKFDRNDTFLEPCAGAGDIIKILNEFGYDKIFGFDIHPRIETIEERNFITDQFMSFDNIVTNPPFDMSVEFLKKSCYVAKKNICMLFPLDYLHGVDRHSLIYEKGCNNFVLRTCFPFVRRPLFSSKFRADGPMPTGSTSFAWFWFQKNYSKKPTIEWLHNNADMGTPIEVDQIMFNDLIN